MCTSVHVFVNVHHVHACLGKARSPLELELQALVSGLMLVLGYSARAGSALSC